MVMELLSAVRGVSTDKETTSFSNDISSNKDISK